MSANKKQKLTALKSSPSALSYNEEIVKICSWNVDGTYHFILFILLFHHTVTSNNKHTNYYYC